MKENFYKTLDYYKKNKDKLSDEEKEMYLKTLFQVSKKLNIDLRKEIYDIEEPKETLNRDKEVDTPIINIIDKDQFNNPLDNENLLKDMLRQRYNNCVFNILELYPEEDISEFDNSNYIEQLLPRLSEYNINDIEFNKMVDKFINHEKTDDEYLGFFNKKTIYRVK